MGRLSICCVNIRRSRNLAEPVGDPLPNFVIAAHVGAHHLNIDRRGQSKVKNLRNDIGGLKENSTPGKRVGNSRRNRRMYCAVRDDDAQD